MSNATFRVNGMTCAHCVRAVTDELMKLAGFQHVDIDLDTGTVIVASDRELDEAEFAAAIDEAGYELVHDGFVQSP